MKCHRCQREIPENDSFTHLGEILCEDCYMDVMSPAKSCDPWAVYSATRTRETAGLSGGEGLNTLQQAIYNYIKSKGRATPEEVITRFNITIWWWFTTLFAIVKIPTPVTTWRKGSITRTTTTSATIRECPRIQQHWSTYQSDLCSSSHKKTI